MILFLLRWRIVELGLFLRVERSAARGLPVIDRRREGLRLGAVDVHPAPAKCEDLTGVGDGDLIGCKAVDVAVVHVSLADLSLGGIEKIGLSSLVLTVVADQQCLFRAVRDRNVTSHELGSAVDLKIDQLKTR